MTSPDLIRELQANRPAAPAALRARIREIAAPETAPASRWRFRLALPRPAFVLVPAAAVLAIAVGTAGVVGLAGSGGDNRIAVANQPERLPATAETPTFEPKAAQGFTERSTNLGAVQAAPGVGGAPDTAIGPTPDRAQRVAATLTIKVPDSDHVSRATQEALDITQALGGHVVSASVATGEEGSATLTVRIPVAKTQDAIVRLSSLGKIVSQQVSIEDLQENLDALVRRTRSVTAQIVGITARLDSETFEAAERAKLELRRRTLRNELHGLRQGVASTNAEARFATIQLSVVTPDALGAVPTHSRLDRALDRAVDVLVWEGVVALVALLVAAPFAVLGIAGWALRRAYRKHEEERLLAT